MDRYQIALKKPQPIRGLVSDDLECLKIIIGGDFYYGIKGVIDHCTILPTPKKDNIFLAEKLHFDRDVKKFYGCNLKKCCDIYGTPKWYYFSILIKYSINLSPFDYKVQILLTSTTLGEVSPINSYYPLINHDIKIDCTDEKRQKFFISPCLTSVYNLKTQHVLSINRKLQVSKQIISIWSNLDDKFKRISLI
jgi:hypothetical protein